MASLPYMQLYVADYLADTFHLTTEEHGAYLLMLFNYWQTGKPLQCERIPSVIRVSKKRFKEMETVLSELFIIEGDLWIHRRIQDDLDNALNKSVKASESAKKRWAKKVENANALRTKCHKSRVEKRREEENIEEKENFSLEIKEIVDFLNLKANTKYKATSSKTISLITSRINEGYSVSDFKSVIDKKANEWIGEEQEKYLRPDTLFSNKFEGYLNQKVNSPKPQKEISQKQYAFNFNQAKAESDIIKNKLEFELNIRWLEDFYLKDIPIVGKGWEIRWQDVKHPYLNKEEILLYKVDSDVGSYLLENGTDGILEIEIIE